MSEENWLRFRKDVKLSIIDVETFSLNLAWCINRPWELGLLKVIGEQIVEEQDLFIKWDDCKFSIGKGAAETTRFDKEKYDRVAIDAKTAFDKFWPVLEWSDYIIAHNMLRFDLYLLKGYAEWMGRDWKFILPKIIDTKAICQGIKLNRPYNPKTDDFLEYSYTYANDHTKSIKTSLGVIGKEYGIEHDYTTLHWGLSDVYLNFKLWQKLKYQIEL